MASDGGSHIWNAYIQANGGRPKNASQLMKWSKRTDGVDNLSFTVAKKIFGVKSKEPVEEVKVEIPNKPKVDMTKEKEELKEYISECKEEINSLQHRELGMEDDYEEGNEGLETQFDELEALLKKARDEITNHRQHKYQKIQTQLKTTKDTLEQTLRLLRKVMSIYIYRNTFYIYILAQCIYVSYI